MEGETSNDVDMNNIREVDALADSPIMLLFKRLIGNENKQNTVLTNAQIMDILEKEFQIKTDELHELEMDIYLSIMKKFLKDWPQWDDFDGVLTQKNDQAEIRKMLLKKYHHLKDYLSIMLEIARPRAQEKVKEVEEKFKKTEEVQQKASQEDDSLSDVVLEIHCSRSQLNNLFFRHPHPEQDYSIFNVVEPAPSKIFLEVPHYDAIFNWWNVSIIFKTTTMYIKRSTVHDVKYTLINEKLNNKTKFNKLKSGYQEKPFTQRQSELRAFKKQSLVNVLKSLFLNYKGTGYKDILEVILTIFEQDLPGLPEDLNEMVSYRKFFCRHPYVRHLSTEVPEAKNSREAMNYDLNLREVISPMYQYDITKVYPILNNNVTNSDLKGIQVECKTCLMKYEGETMLEQLKLHILELHLDQPDWQCTKCKKIFTMVSLAKNRWFHECKDK